MVTDAVAFLVLGSFVAAVVLLFFGESLIMRTHIIKGLQGVKHRLSLIKLPAKGIRRRVQLSIQGPVQLGVLCQKSLSEIIADSYSTDRDALSHRKFGDIIKIVYYDEHTLRHLIHELRFYAFIFLIIGIVAILKFADQRLYSFPTLWKWIGQSPFQLISLIELIVIAYFAVRLYTELLSLRDLLEG